MINKKIIIISIISGFVVAILMRMSLFVIIADYKNNKVYYLIKPFAMSNDSAYNGKAVLGYAGLPYSPYDECVIRGHGMIVYFPTCDKNSNVGEFSIILNTFFWVLVIYAFFICKGDKKFYSF